MKKEEGAKIVEKGANQALCYKINKYIKILTKFCTNCKNRQKECFSQTIVLDIFGDCHYNNNWYVE